MKRTHILLILRGLALVAAAGFILITLSDYLESKWNSPTLRVLIGVLGCLLIWIVYSLSMRRLLRQLRADSEVQDRANAATNPPNRNNVSAS